MFTVDFLGHKEQDGDPVNLLWRTDKKWKGLAVEGVPEICSKLKGVLNGSDVVVECAFVTPSSVVGMFEKANVPLDLDFLKIDIDSIDCPVLEAILQKVRARFFWEYPIFFFLFVLLVTLVVLLVVLHLLLISPFLVPPFLHSHGNQL